MGIISSIKFEKQFSKLSQKIKQKTLERVSLFEIDAFADELNNHPLNGRWAGYRSVNITGNYRLVFKEIQIGSYYFVAIGTHSQLYK